MKSFFEAIPPEIIARSQEIDLSIDSAHCSKAVGETLEKTVLSGGKRLRPLLTFLVGRLFSDDLDKLNIFSSSIEKVHAASLAHDDVIDDATQRRGEPSINIVASNKKAVLAGDFLLADVIEKLSENGDLKIVIEMSKVIKDLALGEWVQSDAIVERNYSRELIEKIAHYKTASVMSWCSWVGAYASGVPTEVSEASREFGRRLGLAFQMMDDTLDFSGDSQKDYNLDIKNDLVNSVIYEWLEEHQDSFTMYKNGDSLESVFSDEDIQASVEKVKERAYKHMDIAKENLMIIKAYLEKKPQADIDEKISSLEFIMNYIIQREF